MNYEDPIVIAGMARTPMGSLQGALSEMTASGLGATAIKAALQRAGLAKEDVEELVFGCVLAAGQGQAPARQAGFGAGLPKSTTATTVNKICGSGMKATMMAHNLLEVGDAKIAVAGGMESMSRAPYLLPKFRSGALLGHAEAKDHMFLDGLEDAYDKGRLMGTFAEDCAETYQIGRDAQDAYAVSSLERAKKATENGYFGAEIAEVEVASRSGAQIVAEDEQPKRIRTDKVPSLKPAFRDGGTVTAANSSSISDGAAALVLARRSEAEARGLTPLAAIHGQVSYAAEPSLFTTAPIGALKKLSERTGWNLKDVDLFEINEAFAVVALVAMQQLDLPHEKVNIHGGACALGHPIGASGARIIVTLIAAMQQHDLRRGMATLCIGGGEATAMAIERLV